MQNHVRIIGWLHIVLSLFGLLTGLGLLLVGALATGFFVLPVIGELTAELDQAFGLSAVALFFAIAGGAVLLVALPQLLAGIGLLGFRPWGRVLGLIVGFLSLWQFPIGTALGAYTIVILIDSDTEALFRAPDPVMPGPLAQ